jgi:hypothetical protein
MQRLADDLEHLALLRADLAVGAADRAVGVGERRSLLDLDDRVDVAGKVADELPETSKFWRPRSVCAP